MWGVLRGIKLDLIKPEWGLEFKGYKSSYKGVWNQDFPLKQYSPIELSVMIEMLDICAPQYNSHLVMCDY